MPKPYSDTPEQRELVALENRVKFLEAAVQQLLQEVEKLIGHSHSS